VKTVILKNKLFGKPSVELPDTFETKTGRELYMETGSEFVVISNSKKAMDANESIISSLVGGKDLQTVEVHFEKSDVVKYRDVTGFYLYNGEMFFKPNAKAAGKSIRTNQPMSDFLDKAEIGTVGDTPVTSLVLK